MYNSLCCVLFIYRNSDRLRYVNLCTYTVVLYFYKILSYLPLNTIYRHSTFILNHIIYVLFIFNAVKVD